MTAPKDKKYVVFKRGTDPGEWSERGGLYLEDLVPIEDAVVIRRQDAFAPPALDAYANAILTSLQLDLVVNGGNKHPAVMRLREIADYFHDQAVAAWHTTRKLPD